MGCSFFPCIENKFTDRRSPCVCGCVQNAKRRYLFGEWYDFKVWIWLSDPWNYLTVFDAQCFSYNTFCHSVSVSICSFDGLCVILLHNLSDTTFFSLSLSTFLRFFFVFCRRNFCYFCCCSDFRFVHSFIRSFVVVCGAVDMSIGIG